MDKQMLIYTVSLSLTQMGIPVQNGNGTDITIYKEFLDAKWETGKKKIEFSASAFFDEAQYTLFYWEFTKETGAGFSFGSSSGTTFQSGLTLMRKVKSVGYGPDGKAFEYSLDIGAIVKTFKETATQNGWKFKVVLNKAKASYPDGYVSYSPPLNQPLQPIQNQNPAAPAAAAQPPSRQTEGHFCSNCGNEIANDKSFCGKCGTRFSKADPLMQSSIKQQTEVNPPVPPMFIPQRQPIQNQQDAYMQTPQNIAVKVPMSMNAQRSFGSGKGFWIVFVMLSLVFLLFFSVGNTSVIGWIAGCAVLCVLIAVRKWAAKKGLKAILPLWIGAAVALFLILGITAGADTVELTPSDTGITVTAEI